MSKDRIWQVAMCCSDSVAYPPLSLLCNPCMPVPEEVLQLVGKPDLNKILAAQPTFKEQSDKILQYLTAPNTVLAGFNILNFDLVILWEELYRAGKVWLLNDRPVLDVYQIFAKKEKRDLTAALKFYCGEEHSGAHDANSDVSASAKVFGAMLERYPDLNNMTWRQLSKYCAPDNRVDMAGKLVYNKEGVPCYNIGNEVGVPVLNKPEFGAWILKKDFPEQTKLVLRQILEKKDTKQKELL